MENKKTNKWTWLYINLFLMMAVMMAVSFIPEYFRDFMGDWKCAGSGKAAYNYGTVYERCNFALRGYHDPTWHWGWRHWLFLMFGLVFMVVNLVRMILSWEEKK